MIGFKERGDKTSAAYAPFFIFLQKPKFTIFTLNETNTVRRHPYVYDTHISLP